MLRALRDTEKGVVCADTDKSGKHTLTKKRPLTLKRRVLSYSIYRGG